jgi:dTDP-4-amino-4,6-dideoxygalactose transaminase
MFYGKVAEIDKPGSREHDLAVIEDCAHACGASYRGQPIGSHEGLQAFQAVKNLTLGYGGALTIVSAGVDARLRRLRWSGIDRSTFERSAGRPITGSTASPRSG